MNHPQHVANQTSQPMEPWLEEHVQCLLKSFRYRKSLEKLLKELEAHEHAT